MAKTKALAKKPGAKGGKALAKPKPKAGTGKKAVKPKLLGAGGKGKTGAKKGKGGKKKGKRKKRKKKKRRCPIKRRKKALKRKCFDELDPKAVLNTYYTCHGVQELLKFRKYKWKKKKKGR